MKRLLTVLFLAVASFAGAEDLAVGLAEPNWTLVGDSPAPLQKLWRQAKVRIQDDLGAKISFGASAGGVRIVPTLSGQAGSYSLLFQLEGGPAGAMKYLPFASAGSTTALEWARAVEALYRAAHPEPTSAPPQVVDSFSLTDLRGVDLPSAASLRYPSSLAVRGGRLLVAVGSAVLEFDRRWMVTGQAAKVLTDAGEMNFAWSIALTPAGTLFLRSADGTGLWSLADGAGSARKYVSDFPSAGMPSGVLEDGTAFALSAQPKAIRFWGTSGTRDLPLGADGYVQAASPGPDGTLWLWDTVRSQIRVITPEGLVRNVLVPDLPSGVVVIRLRVQSDGSFLAVTNRDLRRFRPDASLEWVWDGSAEGLTPSFSQVDDVAVAGDGTVFFSQFSSRQLLRLNPSGRRLEADLVPVARAAAAVRANDRDASGWKALAEAYRGLEAWEAQAQALDRYLDLRPADAGAQDERRDVRLALGKVKARDGSRDVVSLLDRYGPETARDAFARTMKTLEALKAEAPGDPEVVRALADLRRRFLDAESLPAAPVEVPRLTRVELASLFPSLLQAYRTQAAGSALVTNTLAEPLRDVRVEVFVPRYMDFPSAGPALAQLAPGAEAKVDLRVVLSDKVLDLEEDLPVQAAVTLRWTDRSGPRSLETLRPVTLYRRTALTWDDTAKLASFITPREETVARTAFSLIPNRTKGWPLGSGAFERAAAVADALGSLPLRYVPDPQTAFETVSGQAGMVDTVRFPRTTLAYRGGDCDDTTALLASLLEASGIPTALLTSPGHIFLAFNTGEPAASAWLFSGSGYTALVRDGSVWIPVETTNLSEGFAASWAAASALVDRWQSTPEFSFLPVAGAQGRFPPLPLPPTTLPGPSFDRADLDQRASATRSGLQSGLLASLAASLDAERRQSAGAAWTRLTNRLARAQAAWGRPEAAVATLEQLVVRDPSAVAAYLNLSTLTRGLGDSEAAARWLSAARKAAPGSAVVTAYGNPGIQPGPAVAGSGTPGARGAETGGSSPWIGD